ncbi:MAG TPA: GntG family PLP-dependent aldolase [Myxococcota bacterium]
MALIDLGSDTATVPSAAMLAAIQTAALGDEQKGEDPTTSALEERVAALLGKERALALPSATMANQIALALHVEAGGEIIAHRSAHVVHYEGGGTALIARAQPYVLDTPRGVFTADDVNAAIRADDPHHPRSQCVVVENTSNGGGGTPWPLDVLDDVYALCAARGIAVHVDGARLWHAAVAQEVPVSRLVHGATTVQVCFSKGLGCPFGAVLALPSSLWPRARRLKQALGGALRQSGVMTATMTYALDHHLPRLGEDHRRARQLAAALQTLPHVDVEPVSTNLVFFSVPEPTSFIAALHARDVRVSAVSSTVSPGPVRLRACLHRDVDDDALARAIAAFSAVAQASPSSPSRLR